jgi:hypothetical protein
VLFHQVRHAMRDSARFSASRAREQEQRTFDVRHSGLLLRIQTLKKIHLAGGAKAILAWYWGATLSIDAKLRQAIDPRKFPIPACNNHVLWRASAVRLCFPTPSPCNLTICQYASTSKLGGWLY